MLFTIAKCQSFISLASLTFALCSIQYFQNKHAFKHCGVHVRVLLARLVSIIYELAYSER